MSDPAIDIEKFLDSLTMAELRSFAKIGVGITCDAMSLAIRSLKKLCTDGKKDSLGPS